MISYEEAKRLIREHSFQLSPERLPLHSLNGLILAEPIIASFDMPRFDNAGKDGYGVKLADIQEATDDCPVSLRRQEVIQAGDSGLSELQTGGACKIMTGAKIPPGVEAIVMQEFCQEYDGVVRFYQSAEPGEHIRKQGGEFCCGQKILPSGIVISPPAIGLLAALGYDSFKVYPAPKVGMLLTGNELVQPGQPLSAGQVYDSNSHAIRAALRQLGITQGETYHAQDTYEDTLFKFQRALAEHDVVLTIGGISVGDFDFVKKILEVSDVRTVFWKVAIKPGMPLYFGIYEQASTQKLIFGLPGNPVSALLTFHQLVQPALAVLMGKNFPKTELKARLSRQLEKEPGKLSWVRGIRSINANGNLQVEPSSLQDSHMLGGLATADCLIRFPEADDCMLANTDVWVEPLSWMQN